MYKYVIFILGFILAGCKFGVTNNTTDKIILQTNQSHYTAEHINRELPYKNYEFTLIAKFTNFTNNTVYLDRCKPDSPHPMFYIEYIGNELSAYSQVYACVGHDRFIPIKPKETRLDTLHIKGPSIIDDGKAVGAFEGNHKIIYRVLSCQQRNSSCELPKSLSTSNIFQIRK